MIDYEEYEKKKAGAAQQAAGDPVKYEQLIDEILKEMEQRDNDF